MSVSVEFSWAFLASGALLRDPRACDRVVVHRIEVSQEDKAFCDSPADTARFFAEHPIGVKATGGAMPYPLLVSHTGVITQTVPLRYVTPHAKAYNARGFGVACIGDFRDRPPSHFQYKALVRLVAHLVRACGMPVSAVVGHDELSGASNDPNKICPGGHLPMNVLREAVCEALQGSVALDLVWS